MSAIEVRDLGRRFGTRWAVRHLGFEVAEGEVLGFLGPNGAGKTTTVRILTGQLAPTEGAARVAGQDVVRDRASLGQCIGVTFEQQNLYERLSVRQNLDFFADLGGVPRSRVGDLLGEAGLADRADDGVSRLSKGLRQRVILARALLGRPRVLFLDEPTAGLDPHAARQVREWIGRLAGEGTTIFLTTHDMEEATAACHRVAILHHGTLLEVGPPRDLIRRVDPPRLRVTCRDGEAAEPRSVLLPPDPAEAAAELACLREVAEIVEIAEVASNLETVFLRLTGEPLQS